MNKIKFKSNMWWGIFRGTFTAVSISLVSILIFALLIKYLNISENAIMPINQVIKVASIFCGTLLAFTDKSKGFLKGMLIGLLYVILSYIIFSILAGKLSFRLTSVTDLIFGAIIGGISGIIVVNLKK